MTASLRPNSVLEGHSATLTFSASILAQRGAYPVTVVGTLGGSTHRVELTLNVLAPTTASGW